MAITQSDWILGVTVARVIFDQVSLDIPIYNGPSKRAVARHFSKVEEGRIRRTSDGKLLVKALLPTSFELTDGDRLGVSGPNGAGKSTLLKLMAGVFQPTSGRIVIEGKVSALVDPALGGHPDASGRETIMFRGGLLGLSRQQTASLLDDVVALTGLGSFVDMPLRGYSDGMRLRLGFALLTAVDFDVFIMDEWLSVADDSFQKLAVARLNDRVGSNRIAVMASHNTNLLDAFATSRLQLS